MQLTYIMGVAGLGTSGSGLPWEETNFYLVTFAPNTIPSSPQTRRFPAFLPSHQCLTGKELLGQDDGNSLLSSEHRGITHLIQYHYVVGPPSAQQSYRVGTTIYAHFTDEKVKALRGQDNNNKNFDLNHIILSTALC